MKMRSIFAVGCVTSLSLFMGQGALAAPCPVPNTIANGQIADATKIMDNFSAVAGCAEGAVTATGTPTTGSIPVFTSSNTIATGNLTGDVTTSGGTATTLSNSGVTPGSYIGANIIVDAKGRVTSAANGSGGGGGAWWFAPPSAAQFTLGSGSSTFLTLTDDVDAGLLVDGGAPASGDVNRIAYQNLSSKNASWDMKVYLKAIVPSNNWSGAGIVMRDSVSGRLESLSLQGDGNICVINWNGYSGYSSTFAAFFPRSAVNWFRIQHDGSNYKFFVSAEGKQWVQVASIANTAWLTNKADQVGLMIHYNRTSGIKNVMSVEYYSLVQ